ncbi:hypothetical protein BOTBODRAFT_51508 [Botryobasidium botryosum FD-172 SS1]|uniref:Zn(2)-C6 fungal-type domain-containing protein n=1 Tax=Botryobasidium botryosum (strain FD-172 SS1) TaxID=930990 RepID=A0A067N8Q8_BOTB1|nr:hypothetical protein BOTBODRAFT_51508 [Botryobasidium botryosum FD-172 SS1]
MYVIHNRTRWDFSIDLRRTPSSDMLSEEDQHITLAAGSACLICRRRKRRCDADRPTCGPCRKTQRSSQCVYDFSPSEWLEVKALTARVSELKQDIRAIKDTRKTLAMRSIMPSSSSGDTSTLPLNLIGRRREYVIAARPGPLDGPASLKDPFVGLLKQKDMLRNIRDPLIDIFLKYQKLYFPAHWDISRFRFLYNLPPSHQESFHPALLDALCLIGSIHGPASLKHYERLFYARLQISLYDCLANVDRLLDFVRASALAAVYCFIKFRIIEGQSRISAISHFAMACGLHNIDTYDFASCNLPLMGAPRNLTHLGDMIHTWWGLFCVDRIASVLSGVPPVIDAPYERNITTVWPCAFEEYADSSAARMSYSSISSLSSSDRDPQAGYDNVYAFRAKSFAMYYRAVSLASSFKGGLNVSAEARIALSATSVLTDAMALYRQRVCPIFGSTQNEVDHDSILILSIFKAYGASILLLHIFDQDTEAYQLRFDIARACARLAAEICLININLLNMTVWSSSHGILHTKSWSGSSTKPLHLGIPRTQLLFNPT